METTKEKKIDSISEGLHRMYDKGIDHAIEIVKTEMIYTKDINLIFEIANLKNSIISKLLNLQK